MGGAGSSNGLDGYTALITAGGIGTRLLPFSKEIPKEMLPIIAHDRDDSLELKPLVQAIFEQLFSAGIRTFYIVVGRGKRAIEDHFPRIRASWNSWKRNRSSRGACPISMRKSSPRSWSS